MARDIALIALATLGLSDLPCHDPCHAEAAADRRDVRFGKRGCHSEGTHQPRWTFKPVHEHEAGTRPSERLNASSPRGPKALNSPGPVAGRDIPRRLRWHGCRSGYRNIRNAPGEKISGVGNSSRTVRHRSQAGPIFQGCPRASGVVQRLGYSLGYSRGGTMMILDRLLMSGMCQVGSGHAGVVCRRSCCCSPLAAVVAVSCAGEAICQWSVIEHGHGF
jgi:hypothetical protein